MGLRDRLKSAVKGVIGGGAQPAPPAPKPPPTAPAPKPAAAAAAPAAAPVRPAATPTAKAPEPAPKPVAEAEYTAVGPASAVSEGKAATWGYKAGVVAVFRHGGKLYAIDNACRHEDGPVGEGDLNGCKVKCPYHDWEYDFTTGECISNPGNALATYAVREADGQIWIGPQLSAGTDARGGEHNDGMKVITQ